MHETTETIGSWADGAFGPGTVRARSLRLLEEVVELCLAAGAGRSDTLAVLDRTVDRYFESRPWQDGGYPGDVPDELADCHIVLRTIAHTAMVDLDARTNTKMRINRGRAWRRTGDGCGQHA